VAQPRGGLLATHDLGEGAWSPQALPAGDQGQKQAERGWRCLNEPRLLASSLSLTTPPRRMALLMGMTGCGLGYAAVEDRRRPTLREPAAPVPEHTGPPLQHPTARGVCQSCGGSHLLLRPGAWPVVRNLTDTHEHLLQRLGQPSKALYA
jgi:hypothetical protein